MTAPAQLGASERAEILDLYGRYALALDGGDSAGWASCFTSDGAFTVNHEDDTTVLHVAGRGELEKYVRSHRAGPNAVIRHHFTNVALTPATGGAQGRAAILYVKGSTLLGSGLYEDVLVLDSDRWCFASRIVVHEPFPA